MVLSLMQTAGRQHSTRAGPVQLETLGQVSGFQELCCEAAQAARPNATPPGAQPGPAQMPKDRVRNGRLAQMMDLGDAYV